MDLSTPIDITTIITKVLLKKMMTKLPPQTPTDKFLMLLLHMLQRLLTQREQVKLIELLTMPMPWLHNTNKHSIKMQPLELSIISKRLKTMLLIDNG